MSESSVEGVSSPAIGRRCVLAAAVLWSLSGVITKSESLRSLDATTIAFFRSLFAGLALLPIVPFRRWRFRAVMIPSALAFGAMIGLYIAAIRLTTAANAIFLQCSATLWMIPMGMLFLGERPDRRSLLGIAIAAPGIAGIVLFGHQGTPEEWLGVAFGLASGVAFAGVVIGMRGLRGLDPIWLSAVNNLGGALTLLAWFLIMARPLSMPDPWQFGILIAFGVVQMAIPYTLFARGLREIGAAEAGLIALLEPILNPIWVVIGQRERPSWPTLLGGLFLLIGVACRYLPARRGRPATALTSPGRAASPRLIEPGAAFAGVAGEIAANRPDEPDRLFSKSREAPTMTTTPTTAGSRIVAVYPDHASAEAAIRLLHREGFAMADLSIVGRDFQSTEEPVGFVSVGDYAASGAGTGAWVGGLFGLLIGAAFVILPGVGPIVVAGPLSAALLGGIEGALAGAAIGGLAGALIGWGVPQEHAIKFESQVKAGKFLVIARGTPEAIRSAEHLLRQHAPEEVSTFEAPLGLTS